jgi:hypothetical protein
MKIEILVAMFCSISCQKKNDEQAKSMRQHNGNGRRDMWHLLRIKMQDPEALVCTVKCDGVCSVSGIGRYSQYFPWG